MTDHVQSEQAEVGHLAHSWLLRLGTVAAGTDRRALSALFCPEGTWRDVLAFTWDLRTFNGAAEIAEGWIGAAASGRLQGFRLRSPVRGEFVDQLGRRCLLANFEFETLEGRGHGIVRLVGASETDEQGAMRAWTLLTTFDEVRGLVERNGVNRPRGTGYSRGFGTPNWLDQRVAKARYEDSNPQVLIVGGGQAGLALAARLTQMGVDSLIVDREERIGDNWRKRYRSLTLHNVVWTNHLPYLPFPSTWPVYIPKDMLANWFEFYADAMELNFWTGTEFCGGRYDDERGCWAVEVRRADGTMRALFPHHVVIATGVSGVANLPDLPGLAAFSGEVMHSSAYVDGARFRDKRALVIGTGTSGHDSAHDLYASGAEVTIVQRNPTTILSLEPSALRFYSLYQEDTSCEDADLLTLSHSYPLMQASAQRLTDAANIADGELIEALHAVGFRTDSGEDGTGWQFKYLRYGGGYYFNVGCSELIAERKISLLQSSEIERFCEQGVVLTDGTCHRFDLVVLATGYKAMHFGLESMFGSEIASRVGRVWGFETQGEMSNLWKRTPQPGLWFTMGSLAQARIFSKYLAMQIWAIEEGRDRTGRAASRVR